MEQFNNFGFTGNLFINFAIAKVLEEGNTYTNKDAAHVLSNEFYSRSDWSDDERKSYNKITNDEISKFQEVLDIA